MIIKLNNPGTLTRVIELISELVTEVRIKVNEFGLSITAMDPANVSMVGFKLPKSSFIEFQGDKETLGVNLENLKRVLRRASPGSSLIIQREDNTLNIQILDRIRRSFKLSLIDIEGEEIDFDAKTRRMEFTSRVELPSNDFIDSIEDCAVVADACSFIIKENYFIIEARGLDSALSEFSSDEAKIDAENCKARYSLEYLQKFIKGAKLCDRTIINFAEDHPLRIDFKTPSMELSFVLAPRVETED